MHNERLDNTGSPREIGIVGTFDVENYGDLLFPIVAQARLAPYGITVRAYSPLGIAPAWRDAYPCHSMSELAQHIDRLDGVLIGGGNIITTAPAGLDTYPGGMNRWAYGSLWAGAAFLALASGKPVAWNAPGVPRVFGDAELAGVVKPVVEACDYVCVRDASSRDRLGPGHGAEVGVVPDTVLDLASVWPRESLRKELEALGEVAGIVAAGGGTAVFHVKRRSLKKTSVAFLAAQIEAFCAQLDVMPVLVAIGRCHGDHEVANEIGQSLKCPHLVLDKPSSLREIAAVIAFARCYIGCSLHGYITALSYGVPGRIVTVPPLVKFNGLVEQFDASADLAKSWEQAFVPIAGAGVHNLTARQATVQRQLDQHWSQIAALFLQPRASDPSRQAAFMRALLSNGFSHAGWDWLAGSYAYAHTEAPVAPGASGTSIGLAG